MSGGLRIALAQFDFPAGAVAANAERIVALIAEAQERHSADLVVFPELALSGGHAQDLLLQPAFLRACAEAMEKIAQATHGVTVVVGWPQRVGDATFNAVSVIREGRIEHTVHKTVLDGDPVLDEARYFKTSDSGNGPVFSCGGVRLAALAGVGSDTARALTGLVEEGAELVVMPAASAYLQGGAARRASALVGLAKKSGVGLAWLNLVGGQDELVFDGGSLLADGDGNLHPPARAFEDHWLLARFDARTRRFTPLHWQEETDTSEESLTWRALVRGTRDYLHHSGFRRALLGLSGGVDSAMVLAIAVDALGADNVTGVRMPSRYTVDLSNDLAAEQAESLGVSLQTLSIEKPFAAFLDTLAPTFAGREPDVTEENLQSRSRGVLMMALSNKFGGLLLTTSNKSELAIGYGTIYGDMCGGYAPIKDIYKSDVFRLCRWRNRQGDGERVPEAVIERPPSAELRENQLDTDSLPPYGVLDPLLARHIEAGESAAELVAAGFDAEVVRRVLRLVRISEWKRRQAALGPRVSAGALGSGRRFPLSSGWH